jgi:hypothetical protein
LSESYLAGLAVLTTTASGGSQKGWAPLSDIWRLYEVWLAERTNAVLRRLLGPPSWTNDDERVSCGWQGDDWQLELRHPCAFSRKVRSIVGHRWWSVSSDLAPDVVLAADGPAGPRLVALDAKARGLLSSGDLAQEASKYLWGIRRDTDDILGTTAVVLVSPYGGDPPHDISNARQWSIHGHPNAPIGVKAGKVGTEISAGFFYDLLTSYLALPVDAPD